MAHDPVEEVKLETLLSSEKNGWVAAFPGCPSPPVDQTSVGTDRVEGSRKVITALKVFALIFPHAHGRNCKNFRVADEFTESAACGLSPLFSHQKH